MYLRLKADSREALAAALKACDARFVTEVPDPADLSVTTAEGDAEVTRHYAIVQATHHHAIVHGLTLTQTPIQTDDEGNVIADAVLAEGYHADLKGDAVTAAARATLEANGVEIVDPVTPQHVLG